MEGGYIVYFCSYHNNMLKKITLSILLYLHFYLIMLIILYLASLSILIPKIMSSKSLKSYLKTLSSFLNYLLKTIDYKSIFFFIAPNFCFG